jgi:DNA repair protein SbcD/Mre11
MRLLHTGDWHLGKVLRGVSRLDEQRRVLDEIVGIAGREAVDLVVVAGDVFETAAPAADAQALAWSTLLRLRATGAEVVVIAGNHDPAEWFDALSPVFAGAGVVLVGKPRRPDDGGVVTFTAPHSAEPVRIALLPFVSQRGMVKAADLFDADGAQHAQKYAEKTAVLVRSLTAGFDAAAVNLLVMHGTVLGGKLGGGERDAQTVFDYAVPGTLFPASATYVALGHLHRSQELPAPCPVWYAGSPIAVDFGEQADAKHVLVVDASPGRPASVRQVPLAAARSLRTVRGTMADFEALAPEVGDALLRVVVTEPARAGLADDVRAVLPNAIDVRVERSELVARPVVERGAGSRAPLELFRAFCADEGIADERLERLFGELLDTAVGGGGG